MCSRTSDGIGDTDPHNPAMSTTAPASIIGQADAPPLAPEKDKDEPEAAHLGGPKRFLTSRSRLELLPLFASEDARLRSVSKLSNHRCVCSNDDVSRASPG